MKTITRLSAAALCGAAFILSSCATATPQSRMAQHPEMVGPLSEAHRLFIAQGRISEGMTMDAVYLAWGRPDGVRHGSEGGRRIDVWHYTQWRAVWHHHMGFGMGMGYYHGHRRGWYPGPYYYDMGPDYVPVTAAVVRFRNGRVTSWERVR